VAVRKAQAITSRSTSLELLAVKHEGLCVSIDSRLPNLVVEEALRLGTLPELAGYATVTANPRFGWSFFDFRLEDGGPPCVLEVKGCSLVRRGLALFPDAPTVRGRRQLRELARARQAGHRAVVLFVVQRPDARALAPNDETDPKFGEALRDALSMGIEALAYSLLIHEREARLSKRLPVLLRSERA